MEIFNICVERIHGAVTFSPDEKYLVTAMQENALHGWRLRDKGNLAMAGYPAKIKSFTWVGDTPHWQPQVPTRQSAGLLMGNLGQWNDLLCV